MSHFCISSDPLVLYYEINGETRDLKIWATFVDETLKSIWKINMKRQDQG